MNGKKVTGKRQDRLLAFFDAVLAIAMTVLALEISVPALSAADRHVTFDFFVSLTCYLISFVALSTLWFVHNNFFSSHDLTGSNMEIVLHLILLFVITLFQPLTRAIGQYPSDRGVRIFYLIDFFVMYGLTALIMIVIRRRETKISALRNERISQAEARRRETDPAQDQTASETEEIREMRRILQIVYAMENPEELQKKLAEAIPEEYQQEWEKMRKQRETSYRLSLYAVLAMAVAVLAAVVMLIFSVWGSYVALAAGVTAVILIRHHE